MLGILKKIFGTSQERTVYRFSKITAEVRKWDETFKSLSDEEIKGKTVELKERYKKGETLDDLLPEAYAAVIACCRRLWDTDVHVSGYDQKWDMVPYDVQIIGGIALHKGTIAEMQTGEGKTLTATMPLYLNALAGDPVHLVTVNDYLCERDCQWVGSILRWLGLTTGVLTTATPQRSRKKIYQCDVVYGTASEFGFDYLRDNSMSYSQDQQVQRGFYFAIVDEIDSILIDEARTPLIISGPTPNSMQMYNKLKGGVGELVHLQRNACNTLATEARKVLDAHLNSEDLSSLGKKEMAEVKHACKKMWQVSKGMPRHKVLRRIKENPDLRAEIDKWDLFYHLDQNKKERLELLSELYMTVDEKGLDFELTDKGIHSWASTKDGSENDFVMLDLGHEYALIDGDASLTEEQKLEKKRALNNEDVHRKERAHNIRQLLRAHLIMERDVEYIVEEGKIIIIDEHTGRPQPGRRYSDGLHQAIEAKEGLKIEKETQTYATITLQNYFRMYKKLAGMTGTAITEASEFKEIYKLDVLQIPTYKPTQRRDFNDEIYMTEREKYTAILKEIREVHGAGRPILIGTESVEVSEKLSRILRQNKIEHTVLNAKHNASEAEVIAHAGRKGAVTVSTNMAGRGTDIKLAPEVANLGGLHVLGTTRHQSRRIDRQLRGRSARLGDPGSSKFFISFEDQLMRLFASPRLTALLQRFRPPEGEPISAKILNKSIETAQKRVEGRNYTIRKHTLQYDDVMNKQRQEIYSFRNTILSSDDLLSEAREVIGETIGFFADQHLISRTDAGTWNAEGYRQALMEYFPVHFKEGFFDDDHSTKQELESLANEKILEAFDRRITTIKSQAKEADPNFDVDHLTQEALRSVMLDKLDELWKEQLLMMDYLREEVSLRTVAQKDPLLEFKHEAFQLFDSLTRRLHTEIARHLFNFELFSNEPDPLQNLLDQISLETNRLIFDASPPEEQQPPPQENRAQLNGHKPETSPLSAGRNDPCPCNSGKKYKKCCGLTDPAV